MTSKPVTVLPPGWTLIHSPITCESCIHWKRMDDMDFGLCMRQGNDARHSAMFTTMGDLIQTGEKFGCLLHQSATGIISGET